MRKALTFLLLAASAASPLSAQAWIGQGQGPDRDPYRTDRLQNPRRDWREAERDRDAPPPPDARGPGRDDPRDRPGDRRTWNDGRDDPRTGPRDPGRADPSDFGRDGRPAGFDDRGRPDGPRADYRWSENRRGGWDGGWRDDRRFDWQGYRAGNRAVFRAPRYYGPGGYGYDRWSRGYRVQPAFYGRNYWIADPWRYRLPPAYGSYRWVRYYDDVALIDIRNGLIADIVYSFFWR